MKNKKYHLIINGEKYEAKVVSYKGSSAKVNVNGINYDIEIEPGDTHMSQPVIPKSKTYINPDKVSIPEGKAASGHLTAPIPGVITNIHKKTGDHVNTGDVLISLEAMKMESDLVAPASGKISAIKVSKGDSVLEGDLLVVIDSQETKGDKEHKSHKPDKRSGSVPLEHPKEPLRENKPLKTDGFVKAPIPGTVLDIRVKEGDNVVPEDVVIILEAMKMESEIRAEHTGTVKKIIVGKGSSVNEGDPLLEIGD